MLRMGRSALFALMAALASAAPAAAGEATATRLRGAVLPQDVQALVAGVLALRDHEGRAFAIVDKQRAQLHVFDAMGRLWGSTTVLLGQTRGDDSAPGVGQNTQLGHVPLHQRTTPAGRFVAGPGKNLQGEPVVWVDYDAAFAIHRLRPGASHAPRLARLATPTPADNRASWGCVVVPERFYLDVVAKLLGRGASVVYVLPEDGGGAQLLGAWRQAATARLRPTPIDHPG
jgi:hypothetical protein